MEKIGIITIYDSNNFGNRLQAYALQEALRKLQIDSDHIIIKQTHKEKIKNKIKYIINYKDFKYKYKRKKYFDNFDKNIKIQIINNIKNKNTKEIINKEYTSFLVGSDQVWNPDFGANDLYFLNFVSDDKKKNSYAASIGISELSEIDKEKFKKNLKNFQNISVREKKGEELLREILNSKKVETLIDPTLLLSKSDWEKVEQKPAHIPKKKYIFMFFLGNISNKTKQIIKSFAKAKNMDIINILDIHSKNYNSGPSEFLYLLNHSSLVLTDSFHASAFSFIYNKSFVVFPRDDNLKNMNSRIENLLDCFKLENRIFNGNNITNLNINHNYDNSYKILKKEQEKANKYLLQLKKDKTNEVIDKSLCTGCSACMNICPKKAIIMKKDQDGFLYPYINQEKCIHCNLCKKICPVLNTKQNISLQQCYAGYTENIKYKKNSSSGGIFPLIATKVLKEKGIVIGASFDKELHLKHIAITSNKELIKLEGSKYLQSNMNNIFSFIKENINDKLILFVGTPCQVAGLKSFLGKDYDNLICIDLICLDLICHGVPFPKLFNKYIEELENTYQEKIITYNFRDKSTGWDNFSNKASFKEKEILNLQKNNTYMKLFLSNYPLRESCYQCNFKLENKYSDITLGDFWGIKKVNPKMYDENGVSAIIINTKKGKVLFQKIKKDLIYEKCTIENIISGNIFLVNSCKKPTKRELFFNELDSHTTEELLKKYIPKQFIIKRIIKKILKK